MLFRADVICVLCGSNIKFFGATVLYQNKTCASHNKEHQFPGINITVRNDRPINPTIRSRKSDSVVFHPQERYMSDGATIPRSITNGSSFNNHNVYSVVDESSINSLKGKCTCVFILVSIFLIKNNAY